MGGRKNLTPKMCRFIAKDEAEADRMYRGLGYPKIAKQEGQHKKFFRAECQKKFGKK